MGALDWHRGWHRQLGDLDDTCALAAQVAAQLVAPRVLAVVGEMGAGKTTFVRALARAWDGVDMGEVASPTYALMHSYPGTRCDLVHIDLWRVPDLAAATALGLEEAMAEGKQVVVVEWADRLPALLPRDAWGVRLQHVPGTVARRATVVGPTDAGGEAPHP